MTFHDYIKSQLEANGLTEGMIEEVMPIIVDSPAFKGTMYNRWGDDTGGYPDVVLRLMVMNMSPVVLGWIEENHPQAWFKPIFMNEEDRNNYLTNGV